MKKMSHDPVPFLCFWPRSASKNGTQSAAQDRWVHSLSNEIPWVINFQQAKRMIQGDNKIVASYNTHQKNNA